VLSEVLHLKEKKHQSKGSYHLASGRKLCATCILCLVTVSHYAVLVRYISLDKVSAND